MAYRPQVKTSNGMVDLPIDAETIKGKTILELTYPIGAVYISEDSTSPASLFGGTWERIKDKFILAAGDTYSNGATGGSSTHSHSADNLVALFTMNNDSSKMHLDAQNKSVSSWTTNRKYTINSNWSAPGVGNSDTLGTTVVGTTGNTSTLPPYEVKYMWKRIA